MYIVCCFVVESASVAGSDASVAGSDAPVVGSDDQTKDGK